MLLPGKKTSTYSIILRRGPVEVDLPDRNPPALAVAVGTSSDTRVVTLSGRMRLRAEGRNVVAVSYSGLTTVTQGNRFARLPNGIKRVYLGKSGTSEQELLPATPWVGGRRVWLATRNDVKISGYTWGSVPGAAGYDVALTELGTGKTLSRTYVSEPMFEGSDVTASPGRFELRIAAVDRDGFVSPVHREVELRVVGVSLPPLAEVQKNDTIVLGADQQVSLVHAEGLTLTTADHRGNVPASSAFGLERQNRASILIHPPGGGDPSTLTLVRRENLVTAWVGPKTVTWPLESSGASRRARRSSRKPTEPRDRTRREGDAGHRASAGRLGEGRQLLARAASRADWPRSVGSPIGDCRSVRRPHRARFRRGGTQPTPTKEVDRCTVQQRLRSVLVLTKHEPLGARERALRQFRVAPFVDVAP
ncbi:MAG: hypothetical protein QM784_20590 [Polyangiaceae bacterium]